jgi:tetratricopeptide (TPR) repeat protein
MKINLKIFLVCLVFIFAGSSAFSISEKDALKIYHEANIAYQKLDYETSIRKYEELVKNHQVSTEVYFNLGNAYFKAGNFAKAILNYERAKKLEPEDEDANFNLKIASLKVVDKIENVPEMFYKRWINNFSTIMPADTFSIIFIFLIWLLFASAALYVAGNTVRIRKLSFIALIFFICLSTASGILASRSHARASVDKQGIIMTSSVYVKSSPDDKGNDLFILHEGTKTEILDELNGWSKIRIANGGIGWMKSDEMEII